MGDRARGISVVLAMNNTGCLCDLAVVRNGDWVIREHPDEQTEWLSPPSNDELERLIAESYHRSGLRISARSAAMGGIGHEVGRICMDYIAP